jgi:ELWxxDGT repeat protein
MSHQSLYPHLFILLNKINNWYEKADKCKIVMGGNIGAIFCGGIVMKNRLLFIAVVFLILPGSGFTRSPVQSHALGSVSSSVEILPFRNSVNGLLNPVMVMDINPSGSSFVLLSWVQMTAFNGVAFFPAQDGINGVELWKSDGSSSGTGMVKDIYSGFNSSNSQNLAIAGGKLFFSANDGTNGRELWASDGSDAGTILTKNINPVGGPSEPTYTTAMNGKAYFLANDGVHNWELWKSDGTSGGTAMVKDLASPATWPYFFQQNLTSVGNTLFFSNYLNSAQVQLYKTDGSDPGTINLKEFEGNITSFFDLTGTLFFSGYMGNTGGELWKSNGTSGGTVMVKDINPIYQHGSNPGRMINLNGFLLFAADDDVHGYQLWKSNGTEAGTTMVKLINPSGASMDYSATGCPVSVTPCPYPFQAVLKGTLFLVAKDATHGYELWKSNGSDTGTKMVKDINPGGSSNPTNLTPVCDQLFFVVNNGLWASDGTEAGTILLKTFVNSTPALLSAVGNWLFFAGDDGAGKGKELWKAYGCAPKTVFIPHIRR